MNKLTICAAVVAIATAVSGMASAATMSSGMSKRDMTMMKKCHSMSRHEMMKNKRCVAMMKKMHMRKDVSPAAHNAGIKQEK